MNINTLMNTVNNMNIMNTMNAQAFKSKLDTTGKKFKCPQCSHKRFVRMKGETGEYYPDHVGRCDRESSCGYHYTVKQYHSETGVIISPYLESDKAMVVNEPEKVDLMDIDYVLKALEDQKRIAVKLASFGVLIQNKS
jgi:DNA-directed RNA polymerase subunit RPC12/RpoP